MSGGWTGKENILCGESVVLDADGYSAEPISEEFRLTHGGAAKALRVDITAEAAATPAGFVATLQLLVNNVWTNTTKTVSLTGNGVFTILMHEATDTAILPFTDRARVVVASTTGDLTLSSIKVYQEL